MPTMIIQKVVVVHVKVWSFLTVNVLKLRGCASPSEGTCNLAFSTLVMFDLRVGTQVDHWQILSCRSIENTSVRRPGASESFPVKLIARYPKQYTHGRTVPHLFLALVSFYSSVE